MSLAPITISAGNITGSSVEFVLTAEGSDTGVVRVYKNNIKVAESSSVSIPASTTTTITVTGISPGNTYTANFYSTIDETISSDTITFNTVPIAKTYGSDNGSTAKIRKIYSGVNGEATQIAKLYGSANGQASIIYKGFSSPTT